MKVLADLSILPVGIGTSTSKYIAECQKVLKEAGLKTQLHPNGTDIEGDWDAVVGALKRCHEVVHEMGAPRITSTVRIATRTDREQSMEDKVSAVESLMT